MQFGVDAPDWDPTRLKKYWIDPAAVGADPATIFRYKVIGRDPITADYFCTFLELPASIAATVNLPGLHSYKPYVPAPTLAEMQCDATNDFPASTIPYNVDLLSTMDQATQILKEIGGTEIKDNSDEFGGPCHIVWNGETRRPYLVRWNNDWQQVSLLIKDKYKAGVDAPGAWNLTSGSPIWIPAQRVDTSSQDPRPPVATPVRDLMLNEKLITQLFQPPIIVRTDMAGVYNPVSQDLLNEIAALKAQIAALQAGK